MVVGMDCLRAAVVASRGSRRFLTGAPALPLVRHFVRISTGLALVGCVEGSAASTADSARADSVARAEQDSINRAQTTYVVDSILPMEEQLRRFRAGLADAPSTLVGASESREALVQRFARAVSEADTAALVRLTISRAEFAYLVYPDSPLSAPPYRQAPDLAWMRHVAASSTGASRLLARLGGAPLLVDRWRCREQPDIEGRNRIWRDCVVRFTSDEADPQELQLFASVIERQGRFKILSYANGF